MIVQKQPLQMFFKTGAYKFRNIHRKTPVSECPFDKVADLYACKFIKKRLQQGAFL